MRESIYLFPSITGGMRSRTVLDKPFHDVLKALGWTIRFTPKGMRRTFNDLARQARVHDITLRAISGHQTEQMQRHYSTAQHDEMRAAVGKCSRSRRRGSSGEAARGSASDRTPEHSAGQLPSDRA